MIDLRRTRERAPKLYALVERRGCSLICITSFSFTNQLEFNLGILIKTHFAITINKTVEKLSNTIILHPFCLKKLTSCLSLFWRLIQQKKTRPDTRHKMPLVGVLFTVENKSGRTDRQTDGRTDGRTDTPSYRDATAHLKTSCPRKTVYIFQLVIIHSMTSNPRLSKVSLRKLLHSSCLTFSPYYVIF